MRLSFASLLPTAFALCPAGLAQDLVAHYQLDEAASAGGMVMDSAGTSDGQWQGTYTAGVPGGFASTGSAVRLEGIDGEALVTAGPELDALSSDLSVSAWVRRDSAGAGVVKRIFGNDGSWTVGILDSADGLRFTTRGVLDYDVSGLALPQDQWMHLGFVFDANFDVTFYLNGQPVGTVVGAQPANAPAPDWAIGSLYPNLAGEYWHGELDDIQVYSGSLTDSAMQFLFDNPGETWTPGIGTRYCNPAVPNTTGLSGILSVAGSDTASDNNMTLGAGQLPLNQFAIFIVSDTQGFVPMPGGSQGNLCVVGAIGRYNGPGQLQNSGSSGMVSLALDLTMTPTPTVPYSIQAGETWNFQCWYRDWITGQGATSNFTDAISVTFQ